MIIHVSHAPSHISAPAADRNRCPYCSAAGYHAPGPCKTCGVTGYLTGEPPAYRRLWRLRKRATGQEIDPTEIDLEAPLLDEIDPIQDSQPYDNPDSHYYTVVDVTS